MRNQIHQLELIYTPISNQEAEWLKDDPDVQKHLSESKIYFIGQKPESYFTYPDNIKEIIEKNGTIEFELTCGTKKDKGKLDIEKMAQYYNYDFDKLEQIQIQTGKKLIRLFEYTQNSEEILDWFTTEKITYDRSRKKPFIHGLDKYKDFLKYDLHYIGISKSEDSLRRLVIKPHDKRLRILSNEHPLGIGSRVTDEIILFFFRITTLEIRTEIEKNLDLLNDPVIDEEKIIADAEKAFIKVMNTEYNAQKYDSYPNSMDGLFETGVDRLVYLLNEDITYLTVDNNITGEYNKYFANNNSDYIAIDLNTEEVELIKLN